MISWHNHQVLLIVILPIYSLKQAPRAWYYELRQFLVTSRFTNSHADTSLFIFNTSGNLVYLRVYVDDIIITGCNATTAQYFIDLLGKRFSIKDLGDLSYFLGIEVATTSIGLLLSHRKYIIDLFARTNMTEPNLSQLFLPPSPHLQFFSALLWQILLNTDQLLEVSNICASLALILHMLLISCLNSCYDLLLIIGMLSSACFAIFLVQLIMVLPCIVTRLYLFMPFQILTGPIITTTTHPPVLILFTSVAIWYPGPPRNNA